MKEFKLTLQLTEVNLILKALGDMPFSQVTELVTKIHAQAKEQLASNGHEKTTADIAQ